MPEENTVHAQRRSDSFVIELSYDDAERLHDAIEYIEERVIGFTPSVFTEIEAALWDADDRPVRLLPAMPENVAMLDSFAEPAAADWQPTPEEERAVDEFEAWQASAEGQAHRAELDRFGEFIDAQKPRERAALIAWLDDYARRFTDEQARWRRRWLEQLRAEFHEAEER